MELPDLDGTPSAGLDVDELTFITFGLRKLASRRLRELRLGWRTRFGLQRRSFSSAEVAEWSRGYWQVNINDGIVEVWIQTEVLPIIESVNFAMGHPDAIDLIVAQIVKFAQKQEMILADTEARERTLSQRSTYGRRHRNS